jgi:protein involved in polysaccharide export with SLBB domain
MIDQQQGCAGLRWLRCRTGLTALFFSLAILFAMSGCASTSAGWKPDQSPQQKAAASSGKSADGAALWERPDGTLVRDTGPKQMPVATRPDLNNVGAMLGDADKPVGEYRLGAGDQITVTIWGYDKLSRTTRIKEDGTIFAPYVGNVHLAGKTLAEAQQYLTDKYKAYILNPQLDLDIAEYASKKLFLIGDLDIFRGAQLVSSSKAQSFSSTAQNKEQLRSALGTLASAYGFGGTVGGISNIGSSQTEKRPTVNNLAAAAQSGAGDSISRVVPIRGRVTLFEAMLELNIPSADVNWSAAYMIRDGHFMDVDFHRLMEVGDRRTDVMLQNRDILYLPSNRDQKVFVLGQVGSPTIVPLYKGELKLVDALTQAGYVTSSAKKSQVKVIRGGLNNPMVRTIDLQALEDGDGTQNIPLQAGDIVYVPETFIGKVNDVLVQVTPSLNTLLQTMAIYSIGKGRLW